MRKIWIPALVLALGCAASAQSPAGDNSTYRISTAGTATFSDLANLPIEKIGPNDLIAITVYDSPELTRTVRVGTEGDLRLPMIKDPIKAAGLYPSELEKAIAASLVEDQVLVDPIVTVSVVEYRSRPISVMGAVKMPVKFQATGKVTLLDALAQAQGLAENAGSEILVSRPATDSSGETKMLVQRIPVKGLINNADPALNVILQGGEEIRVPEAGRVFVVGDVKESGAFYITNGNESTVLKAIALAKGLDRFPAHTAYILREHPDGKAKDEVPIPLYKILHRKSEDIALLPNDILYVPEATVRKGTLTALNTMIMGGLGLSEAVIYTTR